VRRRRIVREALAAASGERILDVGCGPGFYCTELLEEVGPSGSVVGVDSSPAMLELAARRCAGHDNVELRETDAASLTVKGHAISSGVITRFPHL
jgi:arsenite methyltransferase